MKIHDFGNCPYSPRNGFYGGAAGDKDGVFIDGEPWICKYPKPTVGMRGTAKLLAIKTLMTKMISSCSTNRRATSPSPPRPASPKHWPPIAAPSSTPPMAATYAKRFWGVRLQFTLER